MPNLFPVFDTPVTIEEIQEAQKTNAFKRSIFWDEELGDFRRNGAGQVATADGLEAWKQWCIKTIYTQRYACLGYSNNIGVELDRAFGQSDKQIAQSIMQQTIEEALIADPAGRTQSVTDFAFGWKDDAVTVTALVTSINGDKTIVEATLQQGGGLTQ